MTGKKSDKYLVEFIAQWIRDPVMRRKILYQEKSKLDQDWPDHSLVLRSLHRQNIIAMLLEELETDFKIDLRKAHWEVYHDDDGSDPYCEPYPYGLPDEEVLYEQVDPHVRGTEPEEIALGRPSLVRVRGHGWDERVQITFRPEGGNESDEVPGELISFTSDIDIYQHAVVQVQLDLPIRWAVYATVTSKGQGHEKSKETVWLRVQ